MSLSGSRLNGTILTAIQAAFPINSSLLTAEKTALAAAQTAFASCIGGPSVSEVTGHAEVDPTALIAPNGGGPVTGTGTVS